MQKLIAIREVGVKHYGGGDAKSRQQQGRNPRPTADENQEPAAHLDRNCQR